jgi:hypothetical protein
VGALHAGAGTEARGRNTRPPAGAELRLQTWAAISRGAGSIAYDDWPALSSGAPAAVADRLHGAGDAAGIIGRNSSLFGPLRPHRGKIALIVDPVSGPRGGDAVTAMYATLFGLNIQADFIHQDEVMAGLAARYDLVYAANAEALPEPVAEALKGFVLNGGSVLADNRAVSPGAPAPRNSAGGAVDMFSDHAAPRRGAGATGSVPSVLPIPSIPGDLPVRVTNYGSGRVFLVSDTRQAAKPHGVRQSAEAMLRRVVAAAGLEPEVAIAGSDGLVEARFLESADAMLLVALNYGTTPRKVTFTFAPDVPEAIWQNMETGAAVNFVQGADGPAYTRTFGARDVMVLVRGKRLR